MGDKWWDWEWDIVVEMRESCPLLEVLADNRTLV